MEQIQNNVAITCQTKGQLCCGPVSEILPGSVNARFAWRVHMAFTLEIYNQYWRWVKLIATWLLALLAN